MFKFKQLLLITFITPLSIFSLFAQKSFQKSIYFEIKKATLGATDEALLFEIADTLNEFADYKIEIFSSAEIGVPTVESKKLSERRAKAVMTYFTQKGIDKNKFSLAIESEANANTLKISEKEKEQSRRVEILVRYTEKAGPSVFDGLNKEKIESVNTIKSNSYDNNSGFEKTAIQKLYEEIADKPTVKTVKISKSKTTKVEGEKGTVLLIPSDALDVPEGSEVTFILREAYKMSDMLAENLTTRAGDNMLASGGMVKITAMLDGKEIQPVKPFVLMMPKDKNEPMRDSMRLFNGVTDSTGSVDWQLPNNGGFQSFSSEYYQKLSKNIERLANLKKIYRFMTDTCGCEKMYVWRMPKSRWKLQKEAFKQGKITELKPRFIYGNVKPLEYDFYKVNSKSRKSLSECGDTLTSFCKIIAKSNSPKIFAWQERHKYISSWALSKKGRSLIVGVKSYRNYLVKNYYGYIDAVKKDISFTEKELSKYNLKKSEIDSINMTTYKSRMKQYYDTMNERRRTVLEKALGEKITGEITDDDMKTVASYYLFEASGFQWANCDYFLNDKGANLTNVKTKTPNTTEVNSSLIFKELNVIFPQDVESKNIAFKKVRKGRNATLVSIKMENTKAMLAMQTIKTGDKKEDLQYEEITPQLLKEKLKTLDKYQIKLFPNPTSDVLNIQVNTTFSKIQVVNMSGQVVLEEKNLGKSEHQINVSQLPNNIYNIRVFEGEILRGVERAVVNH
jgi:Secretion system C-terminal sorting domain/OmpA family